MEKGTKVTEEVDVNVEEQTEVIRVPQHNNVDASELLNDFASVSFRCLISDLLYLFSLRQFKKEEPQKMKVSSLQINERVRIKNVFTWRCYGF